MIFRLLLVDKALYNGLWWWGDSYVYKSIGFIVNTNSIYSRFSLPKPVVPRVRLSSNENVTESGASLKDALPTADTADQRSRKAPRTNGGALATEKTSHNTESKQRDSPTAKQQEMHAKYGKKNDAPKAINKQETVKVNWKLKEKFQQIQVKFI